MIELHRMLYCSVSRIVGGVPAILAEVNAIVAQSRPRNLRTGLTGALLFSANRFAQVLEGPSAAIEEVFERIQCDSRHGDVVVVEARRVETRDFPDWSMAFVGTQDSLLATAILSKMPRSQSSDGDDILAMLKELVALEMTVET